MNDTPRAHGFAMPAEWTPHRRSWLARPHLANEWERHLDQAQQEHDAFVQVIAAHEEVEVLTLPDVYGDAWTRDTAPIFVKREDGEVAAVCFRFDGWGGKYQMPGDEEVAALIAKRSGLRVFEMSFVLEGGSIEVDGEGTCLTTRDCLLTGRGEDDEEKVNTRLRDSLGVDRVVWLDACLENDHTDGHIDTLARFVSPGRVVCAEPVPDDPNRETLLRVADQLEASHDAGGRRLEVVTIPSAGRVIREGELVAASYCNYYLANGAVLVPAYGAANDEPARKAIGALFPAREAISVDARAIICGGGALHCVTQQQPL